MTGLDPGAGGLLINIAAAKDDASQNKATPVEFSAETLRKMLLQISAEQQQKLPSDADAQP